MIIQDYFCGFVAFRTLCQMWCKTSRHWTSRRAQKLPSFSCRRRALDGINQSFVFFLKELMLRLKCFFSFTQGLWVAKSCWINFTFWEHWHESFCFWIACEVVHCVAMSGFIGWANCLRKFDSSASSAKATRDFLCVFKTSYDGQGKLCQST